ncbi:competence/damage-inducible protein A [Bacillus sp. H-16]|uniref:competence/damage-inducible protein A n=1 Tax=Alteribacter salitolerans TaxID=2912333 RepID=UPI00196630F1|nr:competence/damage-inducible protein A [Alteribacter salitolerans]MBM7094244.1 competence/damage-inducible protein A [Alteribacter salitolerans]
MNAEVIAVGSELLLGQITNSNARFLSEKMTGLGINVYYHTTVGDNRERLTEAIRVASGRADLVIMTGGLGPTKDDLTKETLAEYLDKELVIDGQTLDVITRFFEKRRQPMTANNKKQAQVIKGSHVFKNNHGLACGMVTDTTPSFLLLPGPPKEMYPMVEEEVIPYLAGKGGSGVEITSRVLRFFGIGESALADMFDDLIENQENPTIAPLASGGEVTLRLTAKGASLSNKKALDELESTILSSVNDFFYGYGNDPLSKVAAEKLKSSNMTIASAESLTGGLFGEWMTEHSGASSFYNGGVICYDAKVKQNVLNVKEETVRNYGTVSAECAEELAVNVKAVLGSDIGISFTGVAGPHSLENKEPGIVFLGISTPSGTKSYPLNLAGSRAQIRERAAMYGCFYLLRELN